MAITLVLGGTKTGKTTFAEEKAKSLSKEKKLPVTYLATARALDEEMIVRITKHQKKRPSSWCTIEEPLNIASVLENLDDYKTIVIVDCLTLLMTNLIYEKGEGMSRKDTEQLVFEEIDNIISLTAKHEIELIIISNQVENGLVSEHKWARMFQDITGIVHQKLAKASKYVFLMNAGLSQQLK